MVNEDQKRTDEIERRRDEALRRALNTPPKPHKAKDTPTTKGKANRQAKQQSSARRRFSALPPGFPSQLAVCDRLSGVGRT
jgi:hypothetical protein